MQFDLFFLSLNVFLDVCRFWMDYYSRVLRLEKYWDIYWNDAKLSKFLRVPENTQSTEKLKFGFGSRPVTNPTTDRSRKEKYENKLSKNFTCGYFTSRGIF